MIEWKITANDNKFTAYRGVQKDSDTFNFELKLLESPILGDNLSSITLEDEKFTITITPKENK